MHPFLRFTAILPVVLVLSIQEIGSSTEGLFSSDAYKYLIRQPHNRYDQLVRNFDAHINEAIEAQMSPGIAVAVVYRGNILLLKGYGVRQEGAKDKVDEHTVFRLGSVSKGFASVLTGLMVNEGYVHWDNEVSDFLDGFCFEDTTFIHQLTIRNILGQTAGFPQHTYTDLLDAGVSYEKIKEMLARVPFSCKPGEVYSYQNVIYGLIKDVLEQSTGTGYCSLLSERIFLPLGMTNASADFTTLSHLDNIAMPHTGFTAHWKPRRLNDRYYSVTPAAGVNASISDMAIWLTALTGNRPDIIPPSAVEAVTVPHVRSPARSYRSNWRSLESAHYGMGWRIFRFQNHDVVYHGGYVEGYRTEIAFDPGEKIGVVLLCNSSTAFVSSCIPYFFKCFYEYQEQEDQLALQAYVSVTD